MDDNRGREGNRYVAGGQDSARVSIMSHYYSFSNGLCFSVKSDTESR